MVTKESGILVIGIGNILLSDEGVGVHLANALARKYRFEPEIEIIDGGTMGSELLDYFQDYPKIMILDAVNFDREAGFIGSLENEHILRKLTQKISVHHLGLTDILFNLKMIDVEPEALFLLGIQPESVEVGLEMTETIRSKLPRMEEVALLQLKKWGVEAISVPEEEDQSSKPVMRSKESSISSMSN